MLHSTHLDPLEQEIKYLQTIFLACIPMELTKELYITMILSLIFQLLKWASIMQVMKFSTIAKMWSTNTLFARTNQANLKILPALTPFTSLTQVLTWTI